MLQPSLCVDHFLHIDFAKVGRPFLILDVDNTISACATHAPLIDGVAEFLDTTRASGVLRDVCLVSNVFAGRRKVDRVKRFARVLRAHYVLPNVFHLKPHAAPFREALGLMGAHPAQTVVVGDQIFTDVLGGNRLGMFTVYVRPLGPDHWTTWFTFRRLREQRVLRAWQTARDARESSTRAGMGQGMVLPASAD